MRSRNAFTNLAATNRKMFKLVRREHQTQLRKFPRTLTLMPPEDIKENWSGTGTPPLYVWKSRNFMVAEYREGEHMRLTINRTLIGNDGEFLEGITWNELMQIKREIGYGNLWAVEIFPADEHLVDVAAMRHLWIVQQPPMAWVRKGKEAKPEPEETP